MPWPYFKFPPSRWPYRRIKETTSISRAMLLSLRQCLQRSRRSGEGRRTSRKRGRCENASISVFHHSIPEEQRKEILRHCAHCAARLYLEGKPLLDEHAGPAPHDIARPPIRLVEVGPPQPQRHRSATECIHELRELKALLDSGAVSQDEYSDVKARLLD